LNAAAAIVADGTLAGVRDGSLSQNLKKAMDYAAAAIDSGRALRVLERWREVASA
jgi:anthranilate phosphoribosyltransferase